MTDLEKQFHKEMIDICSKSKKELKYNPSRFLQMVGEIGGVEAAKRVISSNLPAEGFVTLWENGRLDLSVEACVLKHEYGELFTDEERRKCANRLSQYGYK